MCGNGRVINETPRKRNLRKDVIKTVGRIAFRAVFIQSFDEDFCFGDFHLGLDLVVQRSDVKKMKV